MQEEQLEQNSNEMGNNGSFGTAETENAQQAQPMNQLQNGNQSFQWQVTQLSMQNQNEEQPNEQQNPDAMQEEQLNEQQTPNSMQEEQTPNENVPEIDLTADFERMLENGGWF